MALNREQVVQTAERYVSRGKIESAIREYKKVLAENPSDANTLNRVGDLYARIQRIDEAVDFFTQIAEKYTEEGFFVKAIAIYKKIIKLDPTRLEVYEKLAELYHKQGLVNEARTQYQVLADYYQKHENPTSAIAIYQKMVELEPDNPTYHVKLAELYGQQRLTEKALTEHRIIAELMLAHGHAGEAAQVYERGLDIDPENVAYITDAVLKLREAGHAADAARFLAAATERFPQAERIARLVGEESRPGTGVYSAAAAAALAGPGPAMPAEALPGFDEAEAADFDFEVQLVEETPLPRPAPTSPPSEEDLRRAVEEVEEMRAAAAAAAAPLPAPEVREITQEFELDLDEVFVLDMEDDEEPPSLVKPPPDLLGEASRRPAWAQQQPSARGPAPTAAPAAPAAEEEEAVELDLDLDLDLEVAGMPALSEMAPPPAMPATAEEEASLYAGPEIGAPAGPEAGLPLGFDTGLAAEEEAALELAPFDLDSFDAEAAMPDLAAFEEPAVLAAPPEPAPPAVSAAAAAAAGDAGRIDPDVLERTAAELHPQPVHREEDLVTEAEVLAKYGLEAKALERLREALRMNPRHLGAYALLAQLHLEKGRHARVMAVANQMAQAAARLVDRDPWLKLKKRLAAAGYRLDGDRVLDVPQALPAREDGVNAMLRGLLEKPGGKPAAGREDRAPASARDGGDLSRLVDALAPPSRPRARRPAPAAPPAPISPTSAIPPISPVAQIPAVPPVGLPPVDALGALYGEAAASEPAPPPLPIEPIAPSVPLMPPMPISPAAPPPLAAAPAGLSGSPGTASPGTSPAPPVRFNPLEIGEMVDREELGEDLAAFEALPPSTPLPPSRPAGAPSVGRPSLDDTGMSWLDEVEAGRARQGRDGKLFSEEDDFFDLAAELEQELSREDGGSADLLMQPAEQSLEQIVEGFKKGVAENLSPTDYATHFNLGIAYREMGLLDEAIGEFQLAAKDAKLLVECCSMLGLCFLDKGLPELAIKWYRRGLQSPRLSEDDSLGLLYDMGNVYESMGDNEEAYKTFVEIYGINTNYRDVVARIEELGRAR